MNKNCDSDLISRIVGNGVEDDEGEDAIIGKYISEQFPDVKANAKI